MKIDDIRKAYIDFFKSKGHLEVESASLLPANDPTLLFTTAGMVPFKNYFSAIEKPPSSRIVSIQKCLRTTDLEEVGKTKRHLSFFEMLGNFSFGNYFKKEAIEFAWEFSTQVLPFTKEQIWISIYKDDDEAFDLWHKHIGIDKERIVRLGEADNFWGPAGDSGACGPCSELYLDRGKDFGCNRADCKPGCECDRFLEYWNLVFNQYNKSISGEFLPLAQTGIDTGAGLERLATLIQNTDSVFDTDELASLVSHVGDIYKSSYSKDAIIPMRVLTDHVRTLTFAMSDGIFPSNESRGYVLRRMLRRALLFGRRLGQNKPLLYKMVDKVVAVYSTHYPNLNKNSTLIAEYIQREEDRFLKTLASGSELFDKVIYKASSSKDGNKIISGKDAFQLYDTFGFPLEMTIELAEAQNLGVDREGFELAMEAQRERGRKAWKGAETNFNATLEQEVEFTGYKKLESQGKLWLIIQNNTQLEKINETNSDNSLIYIVSSTTPFYAESGGQQGDTGTINGPNGNLKVIDTQKMNNLIVHICTNIEGWLSQNDDLTLKVDIERRKSLASNHSATHLLNASLKKHLGEHISQSGSLVSGEYLRFDFTHPKALNEKDIEHIENEVNQIIEKSVEVETFVLDKKEAEKRGAIMAFGEKYGDIVRVVEMSNYSKEFCGGTHVSNTSQINPFFIAKESSPGAGNRRIEAYAGKSALTIFDKKLITLENSYKDLLKLTKNNSADKITLNFDIESLSTVKYGIEGWQQLRDAEKLLISEQIRLKKVIKRSGKSQTSISNEELEKALANSSQLDKMTIVNWHFKDISMQELKSASDSLRDKSANTVTILSSSQNDKFNFVVATTKSIIEKTKLDLGNLLKKTFEELKEVSARGGGKKEFAQGSANITSNINVKKIHNEYNASFLKLLKNNL